MHITMPCIQCFCLRDTWVERRVMDKWMDGWLSESADGCAPFTWFGEWVSKGGEKNGYIWLYSFCLFLLLCIIVN